MRWSWSGDGLRVGCSHRQVTAQRQRDHILGFSQGGMVNAHNYFLKQVDPHDRERFKKHIRSLHPDNVFLRVDVQTSSARTVVKSGWRRRQRASLTARGGSCASKASRETSPSASKPRIDCTAASARCASSWDAPRGHLCHGRGRIRHLLQSERCRSVGDAARSRTAKMVRPVALLSHADGTPMALENCPTEIALKQGRIVRGREAIIERPDGLCVPIIPFPTRLRDKAGAVVGVVNMTVDISERKESGAGAG